MLFAGLSEQELMATKTGTVRQLIRDMHAANRQGNATMNSMPRGGRRRR